MEIVDHSVLIVIPALNEQESVADVVRDVHAAVPTATCVVIDDGSTDGTVAAATAAGATVLALPFNLGVGGAMRAGFRYARANGYDVVVQVDADGQHDPRLVPTLVAGLDDADIVIGARFAGVGDYGVRGPRKWAMKTLAMVIGAIARQKLTDVTSGFKAAGPRAVDLFADNYPAEYLGDTIEALVIAARSGMRIRQIPVAMRARQGGEPSHGPIKSAVYLVRAGAALLLAMMRPRVTVAEVKS
ncbi:glycosyltransferase family 2 protein [Microbacterium sp. NC79]|uniref:glycosyltransferase family 2 protein n=1 Tax=Microbacterium sp. NC79 TaxID=2851009 RepID=UPI001C2B7F3C|nr:glycosyltransferase family 2 protein [Microbacterium sp. NC79]MBV0894306.1 glycosyltransferase family 2 protein [Microbacterium sp. NC79]